MRKNIFTILLFGFSLLLVSLFVSPSMAYAEDSNSTNSGSIVVQTIPGPTVAQKLTDRTKTSWSWYVTRGSGLIAAVSLVVLMLSGMGLVTGFTFRFLEPLTAWASHRALGIIFGISVLIHMVSLLFDHFVPFNVLQLLVPWLSNYKPVTVFGLQLGSLYVALGVLAFYGVALVVISSLLWVEKKPYIWKLTHLLSYLVILFVFIHALYLGTDLTHGILRWLWIATGVGIVGVALYRLWRAKTI